MLVKEHPVCLSLDINFNLYSFNSPGGKHVYNKTFFKCTNMFGAKQLMIIDILTTLAFHKIYNDKGYDIEFNEFLFDDKKQKVISMFNFNKDNLIQDIIDLKPISIEFTDKYLRKKLPCIDKLKKKDLFNLILNLSKNKIKMRYPVSYYFDKKFIKESYNNVMYESCLFSLETIEENNMINYKVTFDTLLGRLLINNVLSVNRGIVVDKFYKLNSTTQLLYRYLMLPFHGSRKKDLNVEEVKTRLNLKSREYEIIKYIIPKCLESLRLNSFISKWKFNQITTNFSYEHVGLKHQKQVYVGEQLAEFILI